MAVVPYAPLKTTPLALRAAWVLLVGRDSFGTLPDSSFPFFLSLSLSLSRVGGGEEEEEEEEEEEGVGLLGGRFEAESGRHSNFELQFRVFRFAGLDISGGVGRGRSLGDAWQRCRILGTFFSDVIFSRFINLFIFELF